MINKTEIRDLIQESDIRAAIQAFKRSDLSQEKLNTLSIIEAEYYRLNQDIQRGIIRNEEKELKTNQITNNLILLLEDSPKALQNTKSKKKRLLPLLFVGIILLLIVGYFISSLNSKNISNNESFTCPTFDNVSTNKILLIPFVNLHAETNEATPHIVLRDRIEALTIKKQLSTSIEVTEVEDLSISTAPQIAQSCDANVIIWGQYSNNEDSLRLILRYHFLNQPEWSNFGDLIVLKDITEIQEGKITKNLEDAIMSLCTIIALRQNEQATAKTWLAKIEQKDSIDMKIQTILEK